MTIPTVGLKEGFDTARLFLQEAWVELRRVQWPTQKEVRAATAVVLVLIGIVAFFLFLVDAALSWLLQIFIGN
jgi:preprotein translocase subunit SecE